MELKHPRTMQEREHREGEAVAEGSSPSHPPITASSSSWKCNIFLRRKVDPVRNPEIGEKKKKEGKKRSPTKEEAA